MKRGEDRQIQRLMGRVLDGEASPEEHRQWEEISRERSELRQEFAELSELRAVFQAAPRMTASADFSGDVVRRVFETPFRTEVWPQLIPVIRRLSAAAIILIMIAGLSASVEAVVRPIALFQSGDSAGMTALRPGLSNLGRRILDERREDGFSSRLLKQYTQGNQSALNEGEELQ